MSMNEAPARTHLTVAEAARRLGISTRSVQRRISRGTLPAVKLPGLTGAYLIDPELIESLAAAKNRAA